MSEAKQSVKNIVDEFDTAGHFGHIHHQAKIWLRSGENVLQEFAAQKRLDEQYNSMLAAADCLLATAIDELRPGRYAHSARCLDLWQRLLSITGQTWWRECAKYAGIQQYGLGEFARCEQILADYLKYQPQDEYGHFYLANSLFRQGKFAEAVNVYERMLYVAGNLPEAVTNLGLALIAARKANADGQTAALLSLVNPAVDFCDFLPPQSLPLLSKQDCLNLPIFINSRDRVGCLKRLLTWLMPSGYRNIFVIDNASTYEPLLAYYRELEAQGVKILRLGRNIGHKALWLPRILQQLNINTPYVYTDSDVVPVENCPADAVYRLYEFLSRYAYLDKVGLGIVTDKLTAPDADKIKAVQSAFYHVLLEDNLYFHPHDTTFALYRPNKAYRLCAAARTLGNLQVYHLPWHYDYANLPSDEIYYMEHANASSNQARDYKNFI